MPPGHLKIADAALSDTFTLQGLEAVQPRLSGGGYDWKWRGPKNDVEWSWFFNRLTWLPCLWRAYKGTGQQQYLDCLIQTLDDWISANPPPRFLSFSAAWRPLEAARRLLYSWLPFIEPWRSEACFPGKLSLKLEQSLIEHGNYLRHRHAFSGNHLITEMLALLSLSYAMDAVPEAVDWKDYALKQLDRSYAMQVYPDGTYKELSVHYHRIVTQNYHQLLRLLKQAHDDEVHAVWAPRVEGMWAYLSAVMKPNGFGPLNNDSDLENLQRQISKDAPADLVEGKVGSCFFPWAGHAVFRGKKRRHWSFFDVGARGTDHQHDDLLSVCLSIGQADFLVDSGRYTYEPGVWRDYFLSARAHNCVLLDDRECNQGPDELYHELEGITQVSESVSTLSECADFGSEAGGLDGHWKRSLSYHVDQCWRVEDEITAFGARKLTTYWHWHPDCSLSGDSLSGEGLTIKCKNATLQLSLVMSGSVLNSSIQIVEGQGGPRPQGWYSERFNTRVPSPVLVVEQMIEGPVKNLWEFVDVSD